MKDNFWPKVDIRGKDECWEWQAFRMKRGYGRFHKPGTNSDVVLAHRWAWELTYGSLSKDDCVLHRCDNPPCCNPNHLFLGNRNDNNQDMILKGRNSKPPINTGTNHSNSALTLEQINLILNDERKAPALAAELGVHKSTIHRVRQGKSYKKETGISK